MQSNLKIIYMVVGAIFLLGTAAGIYSFLELRNSGRTYIDPADKSLVNLGEEIYQTNCAACHGVNLEGQPNWRTKNPNGRMPAPPHDKTGHTWHHPDAILFSITKFGITPGKTAPKGYESDMPAFSEILEDQKITAVIAYIKSTWPEKVQEAQKEVTYETQK
ncbi:cytochrome c [Advenella sp. FME57]|uniref:c-type cytochrome n=1 Tax=Advenella sp. FME57 TaxID=2742604 RepID=UPI001868D58B|nr:cytochrome c [Advenella sp. FME57]